MADPDRRRPGVRHRGTDTSALRCLIPGRTASGDQKRGRGAFRPPESAAKAVLDRAFLFAAIVVKHGAHTDADDRENREHGE
jgi:hypothetical protein